MDRVRKLGLLLLLYFVQGLPFGFQVGALPVLMRQRGASLPAIGLAGALALPWLLKPLVAPWADARPAGGWGRRRGWMLPWQAGLGACALGAAWAAPPLGADGPPLGALMAALLAMNTCAAMLDIGVDGLAIDLLQESDLGAGNAAQVGGYKVGMLAGGGAMLWASDRIGYRAGFLVMATAVGVVLAATLALREPAAAVAPTGADTATKRWRDVWPLVARLFGGRAGLWLLACVGTYKLGESMADAMFKPFLLDRGHSAAEIGAWVGVTGMVLSLAGSALSGVVALRVPLGRLLVATAALRVIPLAGQWALSATKAGPPWVIAVTGSEHFFGGALTTAMFAFMMSRVDREAGATSFTLLATVEVLGKAPAGWASGWLAGSVGYGAVFASATLLSAAYVLLVAPAARLPREAPGTAGSIARGSG